MSYELYVVDTETTGLDILKNSPIEISIYRLSNDDQRTWFLRPVDLENISIDALRVNGHKLEDLRGQTKYGKEIYKEPNKVLIEIENWLSEDNLSSSERILVAHNAGFDKAMLEYLWEKCNSSGTYPFNNKYMIDTMALEFSMNWAKNNVDTGYSLGILTKKYGIKNERAHSAEFDTKATAQLFRKQLDILKNALK